MRRLQLQARASYRSFTAVIALCVGMTVCGRGEQVANVRIFTGTDGMKESSVNAISLSSRGNLWMKHPDADGITAFDGYSFRTLPAPGQNSFRIYESRTGQLWSLHTEGLSRYDGSTWSVHPIAEIRAEMQRNPLRQIRQIPLIPLEHDHVLFLLPGQLMAYNAAARRTSVLKRAAETQLNRFSEMTETRESNLWISGDRGAALLEGPLRRITPDAPWREFIVTDRLAIENLQRPFENPGGGITVLASSLSVGIKKALVQFDGTKWSQIPVEGISPRQAWTAWDGISWSHTINALIQLDRREPGRFSRERLWAGQFKDVAVDHDGAFWLGTTEGLVRYSPYLWRTPVEVEETQSHVHSILQDEKGRLWFGSAERLILLEDNRWSSFGWPEDLEVSFTAADRMFAWPDGRLAISSGDFPLLFDPRSRAFKRIIHPEGRNIRLIGRFSEGSLSAVTWLASGTEESPRVEQYDGESFQVWTQAPPELSLLGELLFCTAMKNGDVWLGGEDGLVQVHDGQGRKHGWAEGFKDTRALCLFEVADGKLWAGGANLIQEFDGKSWSVVRDGSGRINGMTKTRDGKIWLATGRGVQTYFNDSWMTHGTQEGLPSVTVSDLISDNQGRLWAATTRGLSLFHPKTDESPPKTLEPIVASPAKPSTDGKVTLQFRGVDKWHYTTAERLLYSYRLDEGQWSPFMEESFKTFEKLGSGQHRIEARAMDRSWNTDPSTTWIEFAVVLPWYREPRLIGMALAGLTLVFFFAGLAVNRHLRLIRSYAEVEKIVAIRTRELERANAELVHSQKMKALGTLAAGIAHDFNNILSIIKGSTQIIEKSLENRDRVRTRLNRIKTVVEQGSGIVKSMLGLSRVTDQDLRVLEVNQLIDETIKLLADRVPSGVIIRSDVPSQVPTILSAKEILQEMLFNLVLNAVDAMSGIGQIVLRARGVSGWEENLSLAPSQADRYVTLSVADTGGGIAPEVLSRVFEPFFTTKALSSKRGTGLGLSMVYELAKEMGYGLHVRSAVGQGSEFTIIVPVPESDIRRQSR